jgi:hypothetical protein
MSGEGLKGAKGWAEWGRKAETVRAVTRPGFLPEREPLNVFLAIQHYWWL